MIKNIRSLNANGLKKINGGRINGSNGYAWQDKKNHWHYTVTSGVGSTVLNTVANGWISSLGGSYYGGKNYRG